MDFYCAGAFSHDRADTTPVFELLFRRLKAEGFDWEYSFPRIQMVDLSGLREQMDAEKDDPASYNPAAAMQKHLENEEKKAETDRLCDRLDEIYEQEFEGAKYRLPPPEIRAYRAVFGRLPDGFPQV